LSRRRYLENAPPVLLVSLSLWERAGERETLHDGRVFMAPGRHGCHEGLGADHANMIDDTRTGVVTRGKGHYLRTWVIQQVSIIAVFTI